MGLCSSKSPVTPWSLQHVPSTFRTGAAYGNNHFFVQEEIVLVFPDVTTTPQTRALLKVRYQRNNNVYQDDLHPLPIEATNLKDGLWKITGTTLLLIPSAYTGSDTASAFVTLDVLVNVKKRQIVTNYSKISMQWTFNRVPYQAYSSITFQ